MTAALSVLARHGRSFHLAGWLLPRQMLADAAELYAFCRHVDDLADEGDDPAAARACLLRLREAISAGDDEYPPATRFLCLARRLNMDVRAALTLIDTVLSDLGPVRIADEAGLLRYAHGAAGTVGLMMCPVLKAHGGEALGHASDLGIAMQLTNIARDVTEDAARGRLYLPATWLPPGLDAARLHQAPEAVFGAVVQVLDHAERRYRNAEQGFHHLPARVRPAIRAAAAIYGEIGRDILRRGPAYLTAGRCVVPMPRRLFLLARSLLAKPSFDTAAVGPRGAAA